MATSPPPQGKGSIVGEVRELRGPGVLGWLPAGTLVWLMEPQILQESQRPSFHPQTPATTMPVSSFPFTQDGIGRATKKLIGPLLLTSPLKHFPRGQACHWEVHPPPATPAWGWILFFLYCFLRLSPQALGLPLPGPPTNDLSLAPKAARPPPGHVGDVRHLWGFWEPPPIRRGGGRGPTIACCWVLPL